MKYTASFCDEKENVHEITFSLRGDAHCKTLFKKAVKETANYLWKHKMVTETITYSVDLPNVWRNGAVGSIVVSGFFVTLSREDGCLYAF